MAEAERAHIRVIEAARWRVAGPNGAALRLGLRPTTLESRSARISKVVPLSAAGFRHRRARGDAAGDLR